MNNRYVIRVSSPLVRPGVEIETESSEKYLVDVVRLLLDKVREINAPTTESAPETAVRRTHGVHTAENLPAGHDATSTETEG